MGFQEKRQFLMFLVRQADFRKLGRCFSELPFNPSSRNPKKSTEENGEIAQLFA